MVEVTELTIESSLSKLIVYMCVGGIGRHIQEYGFVINTSIPDFSIRLNDLTKKQVNFVKNALMAPSFRLTEDNSEPTFNNLIAEIKSW